MVSELNTSAEFVGVVVTGFLGIAWYARKFITKFAEEAVLADKARAESDVVRLLREELSRQAEASREQAKHNKELTEDLRSLHTAVNELNAEIVELRAENATLKRRIEQLLGHPEFFDCDDGEPE